jgi:16S rRNA pseudouridine516 synthase
MKLVKLLANLGYGSRKEVSMMLKNGWVTRADGSELGVDADVEPCDCADILVDDESLDPAPGLTLMLNKPLGYTCSTKDSGQVVYDLLPPRFRGRAPMLSPVGRLDKDTSGLLLMTDDGALLHRIIAPKARLPKVYEAMLNSPLRGDEAAAFKSGMMLEAETEPLAPALLEAVSPRLARVTLIEGRYHQVRRMFAAVGNHVQTLTRVSIGGLMLDNLAPGEWRILDKDDIARLFSVAQD